MTQPHTVLAYYWFIVELFKYDQPAIFMMSAVDRSAALAEDVAATAGVCRILVCRYPPFFSSEPTH